MHASVRMKLSQEGKFQYVFEATLTDCSSTITVTGLQCQRWDSNYPHIPRRDIPNFPSNPSLLEDYCHVIEDEEPWCYTTDPNVRWEYCPQPTCAEDDIPELTPEEKQLNDLLDAEKLCGKSLCSTPKIVGGRDSQEG